MTTAETQVKTRTEARKKFLHYVFTTACEGGINYWAVRETYHWKDPQAEDKFPDYGADLDGFNAMITSTEGEWGVDTAFQPWREGGATDQVPIEEREILRVDIDVVERGVNLFIDKVIAAVKSADPTAPFSRGYYRQFVVQWLTDGQDGDSDAEVCDLVIQLGLFGEVVYG